MHAAHQSLEACDAEDANRGDDMMQHRTQINPAVLTHELGGQWHRYYGVAPCPVCQSERRNDQNALTIGLGVDRLLFHCKKSNCAFTEILVAAKLPPVHLEIDPFSIEPAHSVRRQKNLSALARARDIWNQGGSILGSHGEVYLRGRGITCALPDTLRWLPDIYHQPSGGYCSAILGNIQQTGGIHRTYFCKQGKRLRASSKMMLGPCAGGAVRLSQGPGPLVVCEGLETGLSLLSGLLSEAANVWASLSTSGMQGLILPNESGKLIIATDGDEAGIRAGEKLRARANARGWKVSLMPAPDGHDWNDVLRNRG